MNTITNLVVALMITTQPCKNCNYVETNFVYSTDINTQMKVKCVKEDCYNSVSLTPQYFFGKKIQSIWFSYSEDYFCCEHKYLKYLRH